MRKLLLGSFIATAMLGQQAFAAGTAADTQINNTATATYTVGGNNIPAQSSTTATFQVDEILNITGSASGATTVTTPQTDVVMTYGVTNTGNGPEDFDISFVETNALGTVTIYLEDGTNPGVYNSAEDTVVFTPGVTNLSLLADASQTFYLVTQVASSLADGLVNNVTVTVSSKTAGAAGSAVGTVLATLGENGVDAMVGTTQAQYISSQTLTVSDIQFGTGANAFTKIVSGTPVYPGNAALNGQYIPNAEVTYQITFGLTGSASATNFVVTDAIPAGMTYKANSVTVQGTGINDGATSGNITVGFVSPNVTITYSTLGSVDGLQTITLTATID